MASKLRNFGHGHKGVHGVGTIVSALDSAGVASRNLTRLVLSALDDMPEWQLGEAEVRAPGCNQLKQTTLAHCIWAAAYPCVKWVEQGAASDWVVGPDTWTPTLQSHWDCASHEIVAFEEHQQQGVPELSSLAQLLLQTHLDVCVTEKHLAGVVSASLNAGLPSTPFAAYAL